MSKILINFLEQLGTQRFSFNRQKKRISSLLGLKADDIMKVFGENVQEISINAMEQYLHKRGILPAEDQVLHLFRLIDVKKMGCVDLESLREVFELKNGEGKCISNLAIVKSLMDSFMRMNLAGYRQIRKIRRIILSYKDKSWRQWLNHIWSKQQGLITMQQLQLFLKQSYIQSHIISCVMQVLKQNKIQSLNQSNFKLLVIPNTFPISPFHENNSDLKVKKFIKQTQRIPLKQQFNPNKTCRMQRLKINTQRNITRRTTLRTDRLIQNTKLKNKEQLEFYTKLQNTLQKKECLQNVQQLNNRIEIDGKDNEIIQNEEKGQ